MALLGDARLPPGLRVYAIGDVHGCLDRLTDLHADIDRDLARYPVDDYRLVHCGDYVDRGPDPAGVLDLLAARAAADDRIVCLYGNHEEQLEGFLDDPERWGDQWLRNGGVETLTSYGVDARSVLPGPEGLERLRSAFSAVFPATHRELVAGCPLMVRHGDFAFVHAGVRPGIALDEQQDHDLVWIREAFHRDERDHGAVIVHGHTPVSVPDIHPNRINIDTGAVYGGTLTCLVVEGTQIRFLER